MMPHLFRFTLLNLTLAVAAGSTGCAKQEAKAEPARPSIQTVAAFKLAPSQPVRTLKLPGELSAFESVAVYPKAEGFVAAVLVDKGSTVKRGQTLARIEAPELDSRMKEAESRVGAARAQRAAAVARYHVTRSTYARLSSASEVPGVIAPQELDSAKAEVEAARAQVEAMTGQEAGARNAALAASSLKGYLEVKAPFDGVVTERLVHPGALVAPSGAGATQPLFRLQNASRLRLVVAVPEAEVAGLRLGNKVTFTVPAFPERRFEGTIARLPQLVDAKTRSEAMELDIGNATGRLTPGMYAETTWQTKRADPTFFVPASAVVSTTERTFVERLKDGVVERVDVRRGASVDDLVEVFGDLSRDDVLALKASDELPEGTQVKVELSNADQHEPGSIVGKR